MDNPALNTWAQGFKHQAELTCRGCLGQDSEHCPTCGGSGKREYGCGGPAEKDEHYGLANCFSCGHMVDPEEVTLA